jgi:hypothetical protein
MKKRTLKILALFLIAAGGLWINELSAWRRSALRNCQDDEQGCLKTAL